MPILLCGFDACPVSPHQLKSLNHVISCGRKIFDVNTSEFVAECLRMFGVSVNFLFSLFFYVTYVYVYIISTDSGEIRICNIVRCITVVVKIHIFHIKFIMF